MSDITKVLERSVGRDPRIDVARGLAIVGIVLVHVFRGLHSAGVVDYDLTATVDRLVGLWCLSVFAFVGGTFVPRGVRQRGVRDYLWDRVARFFVIYVMWTLLQGGVMLVAASAVNTPTTVAALFTWWRPTGQLWYLPFLIVVTVVFVPMKAWNGRRGPWILALAAVFSIAFWGYDGGYVGTQGLGLVIFFVAGMVLGGGRVKRALDHFRPVYAAAISLIILSVASFVAVLTDATLPTAFWVDRTVFTVLVGFVLSLLACGAAILLGQAARGVSLVAILGRRSLDIYLAHIIMASGARIVLLHIGITSTWIVVTLCLLAGVFGSLAVATWLRRLGCGWLFDGPAWLTKKTPPDQPARHPG